MSFLNVTAMTSGPIKRQTWKRIELTVGFFWFLAFFRAHFGVIQSWVLIPSLLPIAV